MVVCVPQGGVSSSVRAVFRNLGFNLKVKRGVGDEGVMIDFVKQGDISLNTLYQEVSEFMPKASRLSRIYNFALSLLHREVLNFNYIDIKELVEHYHSLINQLKEGGNQKEVALEALIELLMIEVLFYRKDKLSLARAMIFCFGKPVFQPQPIEKLFFSHSYKEEVEVKIWALVDHFYSTLFIPPKVLSELLYHKLISKLRSSYVAKTCG